MNPEVKAQWVADLRSGNFTQGTGVLHRQHDNTATGHTFCCLGVLCERAVAAEVAERQISTSLDPAWRGIATYYGTNEKDLGNKSHHYLPEDVREWAGLTNVDPVVEINGYSMRLSEHNDQGCTFAQIADAIEEQL